MIRKFLLFVVTTMEYTQQYLLSCDIFQWSKGNMTSKSNIFKKDQQEFEQGQIPSNNTSVYPFAPRGSADNTDRAQYTTNSNMNRVNPKKQGYYSSKNGRGERQVSTKMAKFQQPNLLPMLDDNDRNEKLARIDPRERNQGASFRDYSFLDYGSMYYRDQNSLYPNNYYSNHYYIHKTNQDEIYKDYQLKRKTNPSDEFSLPSNKDYSYFSNNLNNFQFPDNKFAGFYQYSENSNEKNDPRHYKPQPGYEIPKDKKAEKQKNPQPKISDADLQKGATLDTIEKCKGYFRASDWERLLFIIQEIILDNNEGIKKLWDFMNKFKGKRRYHKGKRIFFILAELGLEQVFDKLIAEESKYKEECKLKQTKLKSLVFKLVHKIE